MAAGGGGGGGRSAHGHRRRRGAGRRAPKTRETEAAACTASVARAGARRGGGTPAKWVAKRRPTAEPGTRILLRTEMGAGHGGPSGRYDAWRKEAEMFAFLLEAVGVKD